MPMIFIALQCCQCSTMQVKQQKKSSNKWTCVVCNQKQSVRKVYAQGFMAKDVRKFVQSFNMSRLLTEQNQLLKDEEEETLEIEDQLHSNRKQKRTDWSEYIDPAEEDFKSCDMDENLGNEFEPKIATEMPKAVFKKPKLKNYCATSDTADGEKPFMPAFGRRNTKTKNTAQAREPSRLIGRIPEWRDNAVAIRDQFRDEQEAKELQPTYGTSKWKSFSTQDDDKFGNKVQWRNQSATAKSASKTQDGDNFENKVPWRNQSATAKSASKWSCYITEDSDDLLPASGRDLKIQADQWSNNAFENELNYQRVEEDIHPDFL